MWLSTRFFGRRGWRDRSSRIRCSPASLPRLSSKPAIAAREKAVTKLEGLQKEEMDLTQLLLLKQQEISDAKSEAAEKAREVETVQARRLAEVDCEGSVSHVSSSASCSAPLSPQLWALGFAASLPEDVRVKFEGVVQQRRDRGQGVSGSIFGGSEPGVSSDVASSGSCLVDTLLRRHLPVPPSVLPRLLSPLSVQRHMLRGFR